MAEEATAVNDSVAQDATATAPATEETQSLEVVSEGRDLDPNDFRETETESETEAPTEATEETETTEPQDSEKPLAPKSVNRFQELANKNKALEQEIARLKMQESQLASEQELLNEINPDTGEPYTIQEIERISFQQAREAQQQSLAQQRYSLEVQQNQQIMQNEAAKALQEFSMFDPKPDANGNPTNPEYDAEALMQADQLLGQSLIFDENGTLVGSRLSPYQIYKSIADSANRAATRAKTIGQAEAQRATEKMLANADGQVSNQPSGPSKKTEDAMTAEEYAKAHNLKKVWE